MTKLTAQQRANKRQNEKRQAMPQYLIRMTEEESALLNELASEYGSKKAAVLAGLKLLKAK